MKRAGETLGGDGCVCDKDCGDGGIGVCLSRNLSSYTLNMYTFSDVSDLALKFNKK